VLLLNTDTEGTILDRADARLYGCQSSLRRGGAALILPDGSPQTGAAGYDLTLRSAFHYFFFCPACSRKLQGILHRPAPSNPPGRAMKVDWISGAA
jgi:hypothetical protein